MRQKVQNRMAEVGKSVNMTSELGVSFHSDKKREYKRMGRCIYGIRSFAYRIPHAAAACRLRLPRIWNPSFRLYANYLIPYLRLPMRLHSLFLNGISGNQLI